MLATKGMASGISSHEQSTTKKVAVQAEIESYLGIRKQAALSEARDVEFMAGDQNGIVRAITAYLETDDKAPSTQYPKPAGEATEESRARE